MNQGPEVQKSLPSSHKNVAAVQNRATPQDGVATKHKRTIACVFIPMLDQAVQVFNELSSIIGKIQPGHGNPTKDEIVAGLRALSCRFETITGSYTRKVIVSHPLPVSGWVRSAAMPDIYSM